MLENEICQNCRYWDPQWKFRKDQRQQQDASLDMSNPRLTSGLRKNSPRGLCRRHAPSPGALTMVWMETRNADWCGDFQIEAIIEKTE